LHDDIDFLFANGIMQGHLEGNLRFQRGMCGCLRHDMEVDVAALSVVMDP